MNESRELKNAEQLEELLLLTEEIQEELEQKAGNAGTQNVGENVDIKADDFEALKDFSNFTGVHLFMSLIIRNGRIS